MYRHIKIETSFSKAMQKIELSQKEMYSNNPFALRLLLAAEKDIERAKNSLREMIDISRRQRKDYGKNTHNDLWLDSSNTSYDE